MPFVLSHDGIFCPVKSKLRRSNGFLYSWDKNYLHFSPNTLDSNSERKFFWLHNTIPLCNFVFLSESSNIMDMLFKVSIVLDKYFTLLNLFLAYFEINWNMRFTWHLHITKIVQCTNTNINVTFFKHSCRLKSSKHQNISQYFLIIV